MKRKITSREREQRGGVPPSHESHHGLIASPHLLHMRDLSNESSSLEDDEHPDGSDEPDEPQVSDEQTSAELAGRISELTGEYPCQSTKPTLFLTSCLVACALCSLFWLMLFLSIWYLYQ